MKITRFEDIIAWKKAQDLAFEIYSKFKNVKDYGFKDQIQRASISVSNNIAEGFDRNTDKEFIRFLYISKASCSEVRSMIYLSKRLKYTTVQETKVFLDLTNEISKILTGLIKGISTRRE